MRKAMLWVAGTGFTFAGGTLVAVWATADAALRSDLVLYVLIGVMVGSSALAALTLRLARRRRMANLEAGATASFSMPADDGRSRARAAMREALALRGRAHSLDGVSLSSDPVLKWAKRTYAMLRDFYPEYADDFFGEDPSLGSGYLALNYATESQAVGAHGYLERRIDLLRDVIDGTPVRVYR